MKDTQIRVLYVIQGILPTGPGTHVSKLLAYRDRDAISAQVFAFDQCDSAMMTRLEKDFDVQWQSIGMRFTRPQTYLRGIPRLLKQIKEFRPHVIQTHHTPIVDWVARLVTKIFRVPLNVSRAVGQPKKYYATRRGRGAWWFTRFGDSVTSRWVDYYLPNSLDVARYMREVERIPEPKLIPIFNGIDTAKFAFNKTIRAEERERLGLKPDDLLTVTVAALKPHKGQRYWVEAALTLMETFPQLRVALVGKTWSSSDEEFVADLKSLVAAAGREDRFVFTGERQDVRPLLAAADLYVHPSYYEGSSNAVLEAMSMGMACVVTDVSGCEELVAQEQNGLVVPQRDAEALATAVRALLIDPERRQQMGIVSRRRAIELFSVRRMCADLEAVYRRGLEEKGVKLATAGQD